MNKSTVVSQNHKGVKKMCHRITYESIDMLQSLATTNVDDKLGNI